MTTVDIIIPARNESATIEGCLEALFKQDYPGSDVSIYVIDNGSSDNTSALSKKYNIHLLSLPDGTIAAARNLGIRQGKGEFVAFLDAHCLPETDWLRQMITHLQNSDEAACQGYIQFEFSDPLVRTWILHNGFFSEQEQKERCLNGNDTVYPFFVTGNAACSRKALESVGLFDETLARSEDLDISWKLLLSGYKLGYNPAAKVLHRNHESLLSYLSKCFRTGESLAHIYKKYGLDEKVSWSSPAFFNPRNISSRLLYFLLCYAGHQTEGTKQKLGLVRTPEPFRSSAEAASRPDFFWSTDLSLAISREFVFWRDSKNNFIVLNTKDAARYIFSESAACIFQKITEGASRESTIEAVAKAYTGNRRLIKADIDEFMQKLLDQGIVLTR